MKSLLHFFRKGRKNRTLREILDTIKISAHEHHRMTPDDVFNTSNKNHHFADATSDTIVKKLGLTHAPQVKTTLPVNNHKITFNQRTSHVHRQLKKGLPKKSKN